MPKTMTPDSEAKLTDWISRHLSVAVHPFPTCVGDSRSVSIRGGRPAPLQTDDRRLRRPHEPHRLALPEPALDAPVGHLARDLREQPAARLDVRDASAEALERTRSIGLRQGRRPVYQRR